MAGSRAQMKHQIPPFSPPLDSALLSVLPLFSGKISLLGRKDGYWHSQAGFFQVHNPIVLSVSVFPFSGMILISSARLLCPSWS